MSARKLSWKRRLRNRVRDRLFRRARRMKLRQIVCWKLYQRLTGANKGAWWPVHPSSIVIHPDRIKMGEGTRPGFSNCCYIQAVNGIELGDHVIIAPGASIISANHDINNMSRHVPSPPIRIGNNCWIGTRAVILPGVELGDHVTVGAGAVVTKSFPSAVIIAGVPARIIRRLDESERTPKGE